MRSSFGVSTAEKRIVEDQDARVADDGRGDGGGCFWPPERVCRVLLTMVS